MVISANWVSQLDIRPKAKEKNSSWRWAKMGSSSTGRTRWPRRSLRSCCASYMDAKNLCAAGQQASVVRDHPATFIALGVSATWAWIKQTRRADLSVFRSAPPGRLTKTDGRRRSTAGACRLLRELSPVISDAGERRPARIVRGLPAGTCRSRAALAGTGSWRKPGTSRCWPQGRFTVNMQDLARPGLGPDASTARLAGDRWRPASYSWRRR